LNCLRSYTFFIKYFATDKLKVAYESLDFVDKHTKVPFIQFPYQTILCWGSNEFSFTFKVDADEEDYLSYSGEIGRISVKTSQGKLLETLIMATVRHLIADMEIKALSNKDFRTLVDSVVSDGQLNDTWKTTIEQFALGRLFVAKQCIELLQLIRETTMFEKLDLACFLYEHIINKESFQLVINGFGESIEEKDNLIHRLGLNKKSKSFHTTVIQSIGSPSVGEKASVSFIYSKYTSFLNHFIVPNLYLTPSRPRFPFFFPSM